MKDSIQTYWISFCIPTLKSILTSKPKIIKNIPKYELKERSKKFKDLT